jgi:peptidoglycan/xylan/chitin deacetylase (PgdA/CDA1 family)
MRAILTYHSIDPSGSPISVSPDSFARHVRFLASGRVQVVPLRDLPDAPPHTEAVALTFDDGFANNAAVAFPLLRDAGLPATVFAVTEFVGRRNDWTTGSHHGIPSLPLMDWDALGRAAEEGVQIGAHSRTHADLSSLSPAAAEEEVAGCLSAIAARTGGRPATFAYPYGRSNPMVAALVRRECELGCTAELRALSIGDDRVLLPRLDAYYFRDEGRLEAWGTAAFRRRLWLRAQGRQVRQLVLERRAGP